MDFSFFFEKNMKLENEIEIKSELIYFNYFGICCCLNLYDIFKYNIYYMQIKFIFEKNKIIQK